MPPDAPARLRQALIDASYASLESSMISDDADVASAPTIDLFDLDALRTKLPKQNSARDNADFEIGDAPSPPPVSDDLRVWEARIKTIVDDPRGAKRRLVIASDPMLRRIELLKSACPGFDAVTDLVLRAAHLSMHTESQLKLPPLLLQGPPGVGKTHFARRLANALTIPVEFVAMDMLSDRGTLTGLSPSWRAAKPGKIAETLLTSEIISPLIVCDEIDKVSAIHMREDPLAFLHSVLEPENAKAFTDEYLSFPMRAEFCFWILTANDEMVLAPSIRDRLLIIRLSEPSPAAMRNIALNIYRAANEKQANWFESNPSEDLLTALAQANPRRAVRLIELAMGFAAQQGRRVLSRSDVEAASHLNGDAHGARGKVGFVA